MPTSVLRVLVVLSLCCNVARAQTSPESLAKLPFAAEKAVPSWLASTDKTRKNQDYYLLKPRETRRIALPKGELIRLWFTSSDPQKCDVSLQNGAQKIVLLQKGRAPLGELFAKAWTFYPSLTRTSSTRSRWQLLTGATLKVSNRTAEDMKFYLQAATDASAKNIVAPTGKTSQIASEWTLQPNASRDFATNAKGTIQDIQISFDASDLRSSTRSLADSEILSGVRLQARWNDEKQLAVDATLAQLAGGWRDATIPDSAVATVEKNKITLCWPMPLPAKYRLSLRNDSAQTINFYILTSVRAEKIDKYSSFFHAREGGENTTLGKPIQLLKAQGAGALVGLNLDMRPQPNATRQTFVFLEGNEIIRADNRVLEGTGTEDFFNSAWYYPDKPFAREFHGLTRKTLSPPGITTYRWLVPDAIPFQKNLDFQMGHSGRNTTTNMEYRWVAFWYQNASGAFQIADAIPRAPQLVEAKRDDETALMRFIKLLPYIFLVVGTLLWLGLSWRRTQK